MAGIIRKRGLGLCAMFLLAHALTGCVSTEELYAEYDAADCLLVASNDTIVLQERSTGNQLPWEPAVYFDYDSSVLSNVEIERLTVSIHALEQYPELGLSLQGFTDSLGGAAYNLKLAERRISSVRNYLHKQGFPDERIYLQPIGKALEQIDKDDAETHAINRRVELMLLDSTGRPLPIDYAIDSIYKEQEQEQEQDSITEQAN